MELLEGGTLHARLKERRIAYDEWLAARYIRAMTLAVHYCHLRGVCHRDIKLENFVRASGP